MASTPEPDDEKSRHWKRIEWLLLTFTTREHFIRFMATGILAITTYMVTHDIKMPEGWWGIFGMVIGYYFRGDSKPPQEPPLGPA